MIKIKLLTQTAASPLELASHAALSCYQAEMPEIGKTIDVDGRLFSTGHHTTLQHTYFTFAIENIAVGDITFGFHLASPFYNSDQRSGRFSAKMFTEPDPEKIRSYIATFWPEMNDAAINEVMDYIQSGIDIYQANIASATEIAERFIKEERPFANEKYIAQNAPKIAQEQLRMFISAIFPTAFDYTVNLTVLAALYRTAWTPAMRYIISEMVRQVKERYPELAFMFDEAKTSQKDWSVSMPEKGEIKYAPNLKLADKTGNLSFKTPKPEEMHPVDLLHFLPEMMDNSYSELRTEVEISIATMGQDQRHRTIRRSQPAFTGNFYVPPIVRELKLIDERKILDAWMKLTTIIPATLAMVAAPYGAMVRYKKTGSYNAILHEQGKRLCWCAQEEIYHISVQLRQTLEKEGYAIELLPFLEPGCRKDGKCAEGVRYCGRDISKRSGDDFFPSRKV